VHDLKEVPSVRTGAKGAVFVVRGRLEAIEADAYIVPTDSAGHVEPTWINIIGTDDLGRVRQLSDVASGLDADGAVWLGVVADRPLVALNVGGGSRMNSVAGLTERLSLVLALLERELAGRPSTHRSRPLVAMPLIGVDKGALGAETGDVIKSLLECLNQHFEGRPEGNRAFDVALVCFKGSDYAAVQHARRRDLSVDPPNEWLSTVVHHAQAGDMAVVFGAGASASLGLPLWPELLTELGDLIVDKDLTSADLDSLDPIDAATILIDCSSEGAFKALLKSIVGRDRHALTHGLIASLRPPLAITTNYDQGYEIAAQAITDVPATVLPWQRPVASDSARVLKLHGDLDLGQIVLSRDQFVAMGAFRRPLAGILQERMLIGHVLAVGTSMSDSTLIHAVEEVRALVRVASKNDDPGKRGTVVLTTPDPARAHLLSGTFDVAVAGQSSERPALLEAARDVDLFLDWLGMCASSDLSFILDARYRPLLSESDQGVADLLQDFKSRYVGRKVEAGADTELDRAVGRFLEGFGGG